MTNVNNAGTARIHAAGVDLQRLNRSEVMIVVGDIMPDDLWRHPIFALSRGLSAIGLGGIHLCGAAEHLEDLDRVTNDDYFNQRPGNWNPQSLADESIDLVVDLTNDTDGDPVIAQLDSIVQCARLSVTWGRHWVACLPQFGTPAQHATTDPVEANPPAPPISRIASGIALQEMLMLVGEVALTAPLESSVRYCAADEQCPFDTDRDNWMLHSVENVVVEVVGAGGTGIHLLESLAPMLGRGAELRIFDPDHVSIENLALQPAYTVEDLGRSKASVIADSLEPHCHPQLKLTPLNVAYQDRPKQLCLPSVRVICADNFEVRQYINDLALDDKIPLTEAGSSPLAAQQRTYYPGRTACLAHRIRNLAKKVAAENQPASCAVNRALTLPGTNMVIAGILVAETLKAIDPLRFGAPSSTTITYDTRAAQRFGFLDALNDRARIVAM